MRSFSFFLRPELDWTSMVGVHLRCVLLLLIAECLLVCWVLEQPTGSTDTIPYHPRLSWFTNHVAYVALSEKLLFSPYRYRTNSAYYPSAQVFRMDFWMMLWGGPCPKRTTVWSSDGDAIQKLVPAL